MASTQPEDVMVLQTLRIVDKIGNRRPQVQAPPTDLPSRLEQTDANGVRVNSNNQVINSVQFLNQKE